MLLNEKLYFLWPYGRTSLVKPLPTFIKIQVKSGNKRLTAHCQGNNQHEIKG